MAKEYTKIEDGKVEIRQEVVRIISVDSLYEELAFLKGDKEKVEKRITLLQDEVSLVEARINEKRAEIKDITDRFADLEKAEPESKINFTTR